MEASRATRSWTFRVENIPSGTTAEQLKALFYTEDQSYIQVRSIVPAVDSYDVHGECTATVSSQAPTGLAQCPRLLDENLSVDRDFYGFTPLSQPPEPIAADIIAVTGLAAHAFGSWAHSSQNMWLRDYLPKDIANARILIYGYPSQLQGNTSRSILSDHTNNFIQRLLTMRDSARCQDRPIVFIGHSLGCLIIKKALNDINGSFGVYSSRLPVLTIIFIGAPHRGLQTSALETLVESRATEDTVRELRSESPTLTELNDKFRHVAKDIDILTCYELKPTNTAIEMPNGNWSREGPPVMMVPQDSACLFLPRETRVACDANHTQIAKLKRGESGIYPNVKWAIKHGVSKAIEEYDTVGLSRLHLHSGVAPERPDILRNWQSDPQNLKRSGTPPEAEAAHQAKPQTFTSQSALQLPSQQPRMPERAKSTSASNLGPLDNVVPQWPERIEDPHITEDKQSLAKSLTFAASETVSSLSGERMHVLGANPSEASITHIGTPMGTEVGKSEQTSAAPDVIASKQHRQQDDLARPASTMKEPDPLIQEKLCSAVKEGNAERARELLSNGGSVHALPSKGSVTYLEDPFLLAAAYRQEQIIKVFLEHGADIHKCDHSWSANVLHLASMKIEGQQPATESFATLLIRSGAPLEGRNCSGRTPLASSAMNGIYPNAKCFVAHGADIRTRDNFELMPLHRAAKGDHHEIVALLVSKGAPLEARAAKWQYTPLHYTAEEVTSSGESTKILLQAGADKESISVYNSRRALHMAAVAGNINVVNQLVAFGAALNAPSKDNWSALHLAKHWGHWQVIERLLKGGADPFAISNPHSIALGFGKTGIRPSQTVFRVESNISDADKARCEKLLKDAEAAQPQRKSKAYSYELLDKLNKA